MAYILNNLVPILLAGLAGAIITKLWHGRAKLGALLVTFVAQSWLAAILAGALILAPRQASVWVMTIGSAIVIWIGFVAPALVANGRLRGTRWSLVLGDALLWLVVMVVQAALMRLVGVVAPHS